MGIISKIFGKSDFQSLNDFVDALLSAKKKQLEIKAHAINHAIDMIAKTISKSEMLVYRRDSSNKKIHPVKNDEYYKLNIKPNDNEEATLFFYKVLYKYLSEEDALIVCFNNQLYLADSYNVTQSLLTPKTYSNVKISDNYGNSMIFEHIFSSDEVICLNLQCSQIKETLDSYYDELGRLLGTAANHYNLTNGVKFRLRHPGNPALKDPITKEEISYDAYKERLTRGLFDEEDSILLLSENFGLEKINFGDISSIENWSKLEKKWSDKVAMSFNIPQDIFYGTKTDKSTSTTDFITFGVLPHLQILEDGLNSKIIKKEDYLNGECIKINKLNMQHRDILESANGMDKLFSNGYTHNEINNIAGLPELDEDWANERYITKNYAKIGSILEGGDDYE